MNDIIIATVKFPIPLSDIATITIGDKDADFWVTRVHDAGMIGKPSMEYGAHKIAVKVNQEAMHPVYLFYAMEYIWRKGYWLSSQMGKTTKRSNIKINDVRMVQLMKQMEVEIVL